MLREWIGAGMKGPCRVSEDTPGTCVVQRWPGTHCPKLPCLLAKCAARGAGPAQPSPQRQLLPGWARRRRRGPRSARPGLQPLRAPGGLSEGLDPTMSPSCSQASPRGNRTGPGRFSEECPGREPQPRLRSNTASFFGSGVSLNALTGL